MILTAYDKNKQIVGYTGEYIELAWNPKFYGAGNFSLYTLVEMFDPSWRYLSDQDGEHWAVIESAVHKSDYNGDFVTLSGRMAEVILDNYLIYPVYTFLTSQDLFGRLQGLLDRDTGGDVRIEKELPITYENDETQQTGKQIWEWMEDFLTSHNLGSRMIWNGSKWVLKVTSGRDTGIAFSPELNTITDVTAESVIGDVYNWALVAGQGEGSARVTATVDLSGGRPKKKLWVDANDIRQDDQTLAAYRSALRRRGIEKLKGYKKKVKVEGNILQNRYQYGEDYRLGDRVNLQIPGAGYVPAQIIGASIVTKSGNTDISIDLGEV
jgi:hypothetical protein